MWPEPNLSLSHENVQLVTPLLPSVNVWGEPRTLKHAEHRLAHCTPVRGIQSGLRVTLPHLTVTFVCRGGRPSGTWPFSSHCSDRDPSLCALHSFPSVGPRPVLCGIHSAPSCHSQGPLPQGPSPLQCSTCHGGQDPIPFSSMFISTLIL